MAGSSLPRSRSTDQNPVVRPAGSMPYPTVDDRLQRVERHTKHIWLIHNEIGCAAGKMLVAEQPAFLGCTFTCPYLLGGHPHLDSRRSHRLVQAGGSEIDTGEIDQVNGQVVLQYRKRFVVCGSDAPQVQHSPPGRNAQPRGDLRRWLDGFRGAAVWCLDIVPPHW